jgi:hypothetical protein
MYKILQLFTSLITLNTRILTSIKLIKNTCTHIYTDTKAIKNAKLIKAWVELEQFIVLELIKKCTAFHRNYLQFLSFDLNSCVTNVLSVSIATSVHSILSMVSSVPFILSSVSV